jgi:hypothetical protein
MGSAGRLAADSLRFSLAGLSPEMTATQPSSWRPRRRHSFYDAVLPRKAHFPMVEPFLEVLSREPGAGVPVARLTSPGTPPSVVPYQRRIDRENLGRGRANGLAPRRELHRRHKTRTFDGTFNPPLLSEVMWSPVRSAIAPQKLQ